MAILAYILTALTGHQRDKMIAGMDFQWSKKSWTHNLFRAYELIFWRRHGVRAEVISSSEGWERGITIEGKCAVFEGKVRAWIKSLSSIRVVVYQPIFAGAPGMSAPFMFAIALDSADANAYANGSWNHTCTGSNLVIVPTSHGDVTGSFGQAATYNSVSVPNVNSVQCPTDRMIASYLLSNPSTGTNTTAITGNSFNRGMAVSYSGVKQSNTPDGNATNSGVGVSSISQSFTVTASNCWMIGVGYSGTTGFPNSATNDLSTQRGSTGDGGNMWDSNTTIGTGSRTGGLGLSAASTAALLLISIAPFVAATNTGNWFVFFN